MDVTIARNDTYENFEAELRRNVLGITHITALPITSIIKQYREYKIPVRRMSIIAKHDSITLNRDFVSPTELRLNQVTLSEPF